MPQLYESPRTLEPLLTIGQVSEALNVSRATVYRLIDRGELEPIRVGAHARFAPEDLRGYLERHREERGGP